MPDPTTPPAAPQADARISDLVASILSHTSATGRFVTGEEHVREIARAGLLFDHGPQALAGGAHYFTMTVEGRVALSAWKEAQPRPPKPIRRASSPAFATWRSYCDGCRRIPFGEFLKDVWPYWRERP